MPENFWWIWMIFAAVFIVGEIFSAAFFLLWFGVGAAVAGLLALLGAGPVWQWVIFIILSIVLFAVSRPFADRLTKAQPPGIGADRLIDRVGVVLEDIDNKKNVGRVRIERDEWRAESKTGDVIPSGLSVKVTQVVGTRLVVQVISEAS
jgi:membrane protein implicated in regulation of membrane protease activity